MSGRNEDKDAFEVVEDVIEDIGEGIASLFGGQRKRPVRETHAHAPAKVADAPPPSERPPWDAQDLELQGNEPHSVSPGATVESDITQFTSRAFGLRHDEEGIFLQGWNLLERIARFREPDGTVDHKALKALEAAGQAEADAAIPQLVELCRMPESGTLPAMKQVHTLPTSGRYVVFSDHHYVYQNHRTNFFGRTGNLLVYAEALDRYREAGFTVIENGDVEDLIFFDPAQRPGEARRRMNMTFDELQERRLQVRREQLRWILEDPSNAPLVRAARRLDDEGRLVRTVGNHDYDEQRPSVRAVLNEFYPNLVPWDVVLLDDADRTTRFAIMHGHQLDPTTAPETAPRLGETISETLGLYTQGPDRTWRWLADDVRGWAFGEKPFLNDLIPATPSFAETVIELLEALFGRSRHPSGLAAETVRDGTLDGWLDQVIDALAGKDIGWDYFIHDDPIAAVLGEVLTGDRFFKFRLLDEEGIRSAMLRDFKKAGIALPTLVLGHSHEVRFNPYSQAAGEPFANYINTATAGRFENLMWAVEIVDGEATLVSWSREEPPFGPAARRSWTSDVRAWTDKHGNETLHGVVQAARLASPVPG